MKQATDILIESLLRQGVELHVVFVPKGKTRSEINEDHFSVCDWNKPSINRGYGTTLNQALVNLHLKAIGDNWILEVLDKPWDKPCFSCKKEFGALYRDDDYNGLCVECMTKNKEWHRRGAAQ